MSQLRRHAWWVIPTVVVACAVGYVTGLGLVLVVYAVANAVGTWLRVDSSDLRPRHKQAWRCWATIALLPVGLLGVLNMKTSSAPSDSAMHGSTEDTLKGTAPRVNQPGAGGPAGRGGLG